MQIQFFNALTARLNTIRWCSPGRTQSAIKTGRITVNLDTKTVSVGRHVVKLSPREYEVLEFLYLNMGSVQTKEAILDHLYGGENEPESDTISVFICRLRRKLAQATGQDYIITMHRKGYVFDPQPEEAVNQIAAQ